MKEEKKHFSFTQLNCYLRCGEQYRRRYLLHEIIPPSASLVLGKCGHKALDKNFSQKVQSRQDLPVVMLTDTFSDEWDKNKHQIGWTEEELQGESPTKASGRVKDEGVAMIKVFHVEQSPNIQPKSVEEQFSIQFEGSFPPLIGFFDRLDEVHPEEEKLIISEVKFAAKSPAKDDILSDIQMTAYDLGFRAKYKNPPFKLRKQWAVNTKVPKTITQDCEPRDSATLERFLWRLQASLSALQKGVFLPASNNSWHCSPRFCGYWATCKYHP